jgi:hypothetical protein
VLFILNSFFNVSDKLFLILVGTLNEHSKTPFCFNKRCRNKEVVRKQKVAMIQLKVVQLFVFEMSSLLEIMLVRILAIFILNVHSQLSASNQCNCDERTAISTGQCVYRVIQNFAFF